MRRLRSALDRSRRAAAAATDDDGTTLVEQVVAMSIFVLVVTLFMSVLISMTSSTTRVQNTATSSDALRGAFLAMDRQVRYADSINLPGRGASTQDWFVEFRASPQAVTGRVGQVQKCTQWRYDTTGGRLLMRTWYDGDTPSADWTLLAPVVKDPATRPFTVLPAASPQLYQRLSIDLASGRGAGAGAGAAQITSTFAARNSSVASPSNADTDRDGVSDTPVCAAGVRR